MITGGLFKPVTGMQTVWLMAFSMIMGFALGLLCKG